MNGWQEVEGNNPLDVKSLNPDPRYLKSGLTNEGEFLLGLGTKAVQAPFNLANVPINILESLGFSNKSKEDPFGKKINDRARAALPEKLKHLAGPQPGPNEIIQRIPQQIQDSVDRMFGKEATEPSNMLSQAAQATVGNLPLLALTGGGLTAPKVAFDLVGSFFQNGAKDLGYGVMGQILASSLGQAGFGKFAGLFKDSLKNPAVINDFKESLYAKESELGEKFGVLTKGLKADMKSIGDKLSSQFPHRYKFPGQASSNIENTIKAMNNRLQPKIITGKDLYKIQKDLNDVYLRPTSVEGKYFNDIRDAVTSTLNKASEKKTAWGNAWKEADKLHSLQNWQSGLSYGLDKIASKGKMGKLLNNKVGKYALAFMSTTTDVLDAAIEQGYRPALLLNHLSKSNEGQKVLADIVSNSAGRNINALSKSLNAFNKMADKFESKQPSSPSLTGLTGSRDLKAWEKAYDKMADQYESDQPSSNGWEDA